MRRNILFFLFWYLIWINSGISIESLEQLKETITHGHDPVCAMIVADWCSICQEIEPAIQKIINDPEINAQIHCIKVSFDAIPELQTEFGITKVPTFCFFTKDGLLIEKIEGIKEIEYAHEFLVEKIRTFLKKMAPNNPQHYLKKYIPSTNETKEWVALQCKTGLTRLRNGIDFVIQKCFN